MERYLGIDYGKARIGLAISDPLGYSARGLETINWNGQDIEWAMNRIQEVAHEQKIAGIVIGLPKRTDNKPGEAEEGAKAFAKQVEERLGLPVFLRDERLTTVMAHRVLREGNVKSKDRRNVVDQVAAEFILQSFLEEQRRKLDKNIE